jgi:hypothetical protein
MRNRGKRNHNAVRRHNKQRLDREIQQGEWKKSRREGSGNNHFYENVPRSAILRY